MNKKPADKKETEEFMETLRKLDEAASKPHKNDDICSICLKTIDSSLKRLDCSHKFHINCFGQLKQTFNKCPVCMKAF